MAARTINRIPAEPVVFTDWKKGRTRQEMAARYGVPLKAIDSYLNPRIGRWTEDANAEALARFDAIVDILETFEHGRHRTLRISLPPISMCLAARAEKTEPRPRPWRLAA